MVSFILASPCGQTGFGRHYKRYAAATGCYLFLERIMIAGQIKVGCADDELVIVRQAHFVGIRENPVIDDGQLYWIEQRDGEVVRYDTEPGASFCDRAGYRSCHCCPSSGCCELL
jgi:hypothetical protein